MPLAATTTASLSPRVLSLLVRRAATLRQPFNAQDSVLVVKSLRALRVHTPHTRVICEKAAFALVSASTWRRRSDTNSTNSTTTATTAAANARVTPPLAVAVVVDVLNELASLHAGALPVVCRRLTQSLHALSAQQTPRQTLHKAAVALTKLGRRHGDVDVCVHILQQLRHVLLPSHATTTTTTMTSSSREGQPHDVVDDTSRSASASSPSSLRAPRCAVAVDDVGLLLAYIALFAYCYDAHTLATLRDDNNDNNDNDSDTRRARASATDALATLYACAHCLVTRHRQTLATLHGNMAWQAMHLYAVAAIVQQQHGNKSNKSNNSVSNNTASASDAWRVLCAHYAALLPLQHMSASSHAQFVYDFAPQLACDVPLLLRVVSVVTTPTWRARCTTFDVAKVATAVSELPLLLLLLQPHDNSTSSNNIDSNDNDNDDTTTSRVRCVEPLADTLLALLHSCTHALQRLVHVRKKYNGSDDDDKDDDDEAAQHAHGAAVAATWQLLLRSAVAITRHDDDAHDTTTSSCVRDALRTQMHTLLCVTEALCHHDNNNNNCNADADVMRVADAAWAAHTLCSLLRSSTLSSLLLAATTNTTTTAAAATPRRRVQRVLATLLQRCLARAHALDALSLRVRVQAMHAAATMLMTRRARTASQQQQQRQQQQVRDDCVRVLIAYGNSVAAERATRLHSADARLLLDVVVVRLGSALHDAQQQQQQQHDNDDSHASMLRALARVTRQAVRVRGVCRYTAAAALLTLLSLRTGNSADADAHTSSLWRALRELLDAHTSSHDDCDDVHTKGNGTRACERVTAQRRRREQQQQPQHVQLPHTAVAMRAMLTSAVRLYDSRGTARTSSSSLSSSLHAHVHAQLLACVGAWWQHVMQCATTTTTTVVTHARSNNDNKSSSRVRGLGDDVWRSLELAMQLGAHVRFAADDDNDDGCYYYTSTLTTMSSSSLPACVQSPPPPPQHVLYVDVQRLLDARRLSRDDAARVLCLLASRVAAAAAASSSSLSLSLRLQQQQQLHNASSDAAHGRGVALYMPAATHAALRSLALDDANAHADTVTTATRHDATATTTTRDEAMSHAALCALLAANAHARVSCVLFDTHALTRLLQHVTAHLSRLCDDGVDDNSSRRHHSDDDDDDDNDGCCRMRRQRAARVLRLLLDSQLPQRLGHATLRRSDGLCSVLRRVCAMLRQQQQQHEQRTHDRNSDDGDSDDGVSSRAHTMPLYMLRAELLYSDDDDTGNIASSSATTTTTTTHVTGE